MKKYLFFWFLLLPLLGFGQAKFSIDFLQGIEFSHRNLQPIDERNSNAPLSKNRNNEVGKVSYRFGVNFNQQIKPSIYFKTGFRFVKTGYRSEINKISEADVMQIFANTSGFPSVLPAGDYQTAYNHVFFEIPLVIRYEFENHRLTPFLEVGMSPNWYIITETRDLFFEETSKEKIENASPVNMVGSLSFGMNYQLGNNFQLFGQPIVRYHLTSLTKGKEQENLYNVGMEMGMRVKL